MSYDIYLTAMRPSVVFESNMTSNVAGIWSDSLRVVTGVERTEHPWGAFSALATLPTTEERASALRAAASHIRANPEIYKPMEPSNGWGSAEGAAIFLDELAGALEQNPDATMELHR